MYIRSKFVRAGRWSFAGRIQADRSLIRSPNDELWEYDCRSRRWRVRARDPHRVYCNRSLDTSGPRVPGTADLGKRTTKQGPQKAAFGPGAVKAIG